MEAGRRREEEGGVRSKKERGEKEERGEEE